MCKSILTLTFILFFYSFALSQPLGKVIETKTITSSVLGRNVEYAVYLPADYETSERFYPVVYLLHGLSGDNTQWLQRGEINRYVDNAIMDEQFHL